MTRAERLTELFNRKSCSSREFLEADFGHWPPNDLNVSEPVKGQVHFYEVGTYRAFLSLFARGPHDIERLVKLYDVQSRDDPSILSESSVKACTRLTPLFVPFVNFRSVMFGDPTTKAFTRTAWSKRGIYVVDPQEAIQDKEAFANLLSHEHTHLLQNDALDAGQDIVFDNKKLKQVFDKGEKYDRQAREYIDYVTAGTEIQARLAPTVATHYQATQVMPVTTHELLVLLHAGGAMPDFHFSLVYDFEDRSNEVLEAKERMKLDDNTSIKIPYREDMRDIAFLLGNINAAYEFWREIIPELYADLVHNWGDPQIAGKIASTEWKLSYN